MTGSVTQLWRFPVKSMGGASVESVRIDGRGVHADRLWAVRDLEKGVTASARRLPVLLGCSARYVREPGADAGPGNVPGVVVEFPDGRELTGDDPAVHVALSELIGREARLVALPPVDDTTHHRMRMSDSMAYFRAAQVRKDFGLADTEALPDTSMFSSKDIMTLARYSTPPGTFVDLSPVHVMSTASLRALSPDGEPYSVRRFRPNVLVDVDPFEREFPESAWAGSDVVMGGVRLRVTSPTIRCVVPTHPQPGLELDRAITRQLADRTGRFLGVYADVTAPGVVRVGDEIAVVQPAPPRVLQRLTDSVGKTVIRQVQRVMEATVLRDRG